jgi:hypothetical protein
MMAPVKFADDRVILIEVGLRATQGVMVGGDQRSVEPFVGMKHDG